MIEDNAECHLGTYKSNLFVTIENRMCFSYKSSKQLTSKDSGIIVIDKTDLQKIRKVLCFGKSTIKATK